MEKNKIKNFLYSFEQIPSLVYLLKWVLICLALGILAGSVSAFFLLSLEWERISFMDYLVIARRWVYNWFIVSLIW